MRNKIYHFLVNRQPGIQKRYHRMHDNTSGVKKILSWFYLLWLNFAYYILFCRFLGKEEVRIETEEKKLLVTVSESSSSPVYQKYLDQLLQYEMISFDIFDTLIFRPFSEPTDLFYFLGQKLDYMDFKRLRMEAEYEARMEKHRLKNTYEVTLAEIWKKLEEKTGLAMEKGMEIEQELELQFCYGNPFMHSVFQELVKAGKKIFIISDMYLSSDFLQKLLEKNGYSGYEKLYVSCECQKNKGTGELFSYVKKEWNLKDHQIIHVGDNENSDVKQAFKQGFDTCYYPNVNKNSLLYRPYDMSPIIGGAYRGIVNNHIYCGMKKTSMEYEYGYIYGGLFVVGYCGFIHDYCQKNQIDKVLFLSRDGDILRQVYEKMYPKDQTEYVYWSRKAATKLMASSDRYDFFRRFLFHKVNQNVTIGQIFASMETEFLLEQLPSSLNSGMVLTSSNVKEVKNFIQEHWEEVLSYYEKEHAAAKYYYEEILSGCAKAAAVDIGWAGSGAIALNHLVNSVWNLSCNITGILAGTNTIHNVEMDASESYLQSGQLVSYLYSLSHNRDLMKKHDLNKDYNVYWELLLSSPTSQFVGFDWEDDARTKVKLRFGKKDANQKGICEVQEGILQFAEDYAGHFKEVPYMFCISGRDAYAPMLVAASQNEKYLKVIKEKFNLIVGVE